MLADVCSLALVTKCYKHTSSVQPFTTGMMLLIFKLLSSQEFAWCECQTGRQVLWSAWICRKHMYTLLEWVREGCSTCATLIATNLSAGIESSASVSQNCQVKLSASQPEQNCQLESESTAGAGVGVDSESVWRSVWERRNKRNKLNWLTIQRFTHLDFSSSQLNYRLARYQDLLLALTRNIGVKCMADPSNCMAELHGGS